MGEKVNLMEIVKKTLSRYIDLELDPKYLVIKDDKSGKEIDFEWFIGHLQEDYDEQLKGRWIPISERLPRESDGVVLIVVNGEVKTARYSEFSNTWYKGDMYSVGGDNPIAWQPLPKPYKAEMESE